MNNLDIKLPEPIMNNSDMSMDVRWARAAQQVGWLEAKLPEPMILLLQKYIDTAKKNPINAKDKLAGNISSSFYLTDENNLFFDTVLVALIKIFSQQFPAYTHQKAVTTKDVPYCLNPFWVNFQKKHEFNPPHNHSGLFSFVVWIKIPTDWREQHTLPISSNSNAPTASDFHFLFTSMLGEITNHAFKLDKGAEGMMLFFPAPLYHTVYPFYNSDEERISISGNIAMKID